MTATKTHAVLWLTGSLQHLQFNLNALMLYHILLLHHIKQVGLAGVTLR